MIEIKEKDKCCGCTACYSVCPKSAIQMEADEEGFKYPVVNKDICVDCELCEKVCPIISEKPTGVGISQKYAVQNSDDSERYMSTAGGVFSLIANWVIEEKKGFVYAVGFNDTTILHKRAEEKYQLEEMRGSKYVQSELGDIFKEVKQNLLCGKECLFVGTPCQVYGLSKYIGNSNLRNYLILVDLLCLGVSSPLLYEKWISYIEDKYHKSVRRVYFRDKSYGYATANVRVEFKNGKFIEQKYDAKSLMKTFFSGYNMRPSCYDCSFRCVDRVSDFTIGDFHQIGQYCKQMDDDKGTTCLWIHTVKAQELFEKCKEKMKYHVLDRNCSSTLDTFSKKTSIPKDRDLFWKDTNRLDYLDFSKKWAENDIKSIMANFVKPMINKMPFRSYFFRLIKRIKQRKFEKRVYNANK
ncbi:MAG TPA: Coenzyme F420 hydrogenase/dehydrogenase, beta subunit C-terminal domain [Candidatus Cottocaccamicrobium excrementipullorum]|nr:Coenzyme F420 hydrogenase/dehydrogenase, beta subunit C-terminal domain [Candidatus Cottocaccamicrobium excrementipullorum]